MQYVITGISIDGRISIPWRMWQRWDGAWFAYWGRWPSTRAEISAPTRNEAMRKVKAWLEYYGFEEIKIQRFRDWEELP